MVVGGQGYSHFLFSKQSSLMFGFFWSSAVSGFTNEEIMEKTVVFLGGALAPCALAKGWVRGPASPWFCFQQHTAGVPTTILLFLHLLSS